MIDPIIAQIIESNNGNIRSVDKNGAKFYSVIDFIGHATTTKIPKTYWKNLKFRHENLERFVTKLKIKAVDNKMRLTDCATVGTLWCIYNCIPKDSRK